MPYFGLQNIEILNKINEKSEKKICIAFILIYLKNKETIKIHN